MAAGVINQKCPFCDEMFKHEVTATVGAKNDQGGVGYTLNVKVTPEFTAHVWTHAPKALRGEE